MSTIPEVDDLGAALAVMAAPLGRRRLDRALAEHPTISSVFESLLEDRDCGDFLRGCNPTRLERALEHLGGKLVAACDSAYPQLLRQVAHPAPFLVVAGDHSLLEAPMIAMVGTRRATITGRRVAARIGREIAESGVSVVSGMALGIDAAAHGGVLDSHGGTSGRPVGVLACGLDVVYPKANAGLFGRVLDRGLLISEFGIGTAPEKWRFPVRNRTIAGIALGVVVVEAHATGGALSTAAAGREANREVMVVPGSVDNPAAEGITALLRDGATPVASGRDALMAIAGLDAGSTSTESSVPPGHASSPSLFAEIPLSDVIMDLLGDGAERSAFEIADEAGVSVAVLLDSLQPLLAAGSIERSGDGSFAMVSSRR
ncbi:MAG: DNA-protecting protein DprA [Acidobacteria bacterium]|nr:MAG: DNA-protecting protein DprA [Acidobacteriota bacterium]